MTNNKPTKKEKPGKRLRIILIGLGGLVLLVAAYFLIGWPTEHENVAYGITWSKPYAEELGLDSDEGLEFMLKETGVRHLRLPAYWNLIEGERGNYDFLWLDRQLDLANAYDAEVTLALGSRLPRWPECWEPDWALDLSDEERREAQLDFIGQVYRRYAEHPAIKRWQVENEASFTLFARCEGLTKDLAREEMELIMGYERSRPPHMRRPVMTTDSGELSTWLAFAGSINEKGISIYRVVINPWFGVVRHWYIPPWFYARKAALVRPLVGEFHVSEFQMEPWADMPLTALKTESQLMTFDITQMKKNLLFAKRTGLNEIHFWGAEWWLWMMRERNHPEFIERMSAFFQENR